MVDVTQAERVRQQLNRPPLKVIAVTSGKGGVGKTAVAANLSVALAAARQNTLLFDADMGLANVDVMLGLQPRFNLAHVANGETDLDSTILTGPAGVRVIPASSGDLSMIDLPQVAQASIISAFAGLADQPDILLIDTAAGLSESVARFVQAAQEAIVVICDEPASITDSYALIKVLSRRYGVSHFEVITNQTRNHADGKALFDKVRRVTDRYLDAVLRHLGDIPADMLLRRSIQQQQAVVDAYPRSESARAFRRIASRISERPAIRRRAGGIEFFFERIMHADEQAERRIA